MMACLTCERIGRRDRLEAPDWDNILRTAHWDLVHACDTSLPGWLVLVARRHFEAVDELTDEEAAELGILLRQTSAALREITDCVKTYIIQFAEATGHPHVHFHVIPRMADQPPERRSVGIFGYLGVPEEERVSETFMNSIAARIRHMIKSPIDLDASEF